MKFRMNNMGTIVFILAVIGLIAMFLTWRERTVFADLSGFGTLKDGASYAMLVLFGLVVSLLLGFIELLGKGSGPTRVVLLIMGILVTAGGIMAWNSIGGTYGSSVGIGVYLEMFIGLLMTAASLFGIREISQGS
ncbi:MAG: hypothetical protein LBH69_01355 [Methanomassiliicoccaceae archaeon]|jgi:hypothetical protein|nr:hypothetical protein [Methanomassiliicoccaceae archaeon]